MLPDIDSAPLYDGAVTLKKYDAGALQLYIFTKDDGHIEMWSDDVQRLKTFLNSSALLNPARTT